MVTMYNAKCGYIYFVLAGKNKCVGGGGLHRILKNVIGLRIDEKVGNHCTQHINYQGTH